MSNGNHHIFPISDESDEKFPGSVQGERCGREKDNHWRNVVAIKNQLIHHMIQIFYFILH